MQAPGSPLEAALIDDSSEGGEVLDRQIHDSNTEHSFICIKIFRQTEVEIRVPLEIAS